MTPDEIEAIAEALAERVGARKHDFWIAPAQHYDDHQRIKDRAVTNEDDADIKQLLAMYRTARGLFFKSFIGLAIIGAIALAGIGILKELFK